MSTAEQTQQPQPKGPRFGFFVAVALELMMLAIFLGRGVWEGVAVWVIYSYFTATWALVVRTFRGQV